MAFEIANIKNASALMQLISFSDFCNPLRQAEPVDVNSMFMLNFTGGFSVDNASACRWPEIRAIHSNKKADENFILSGLESGGSVLLVMYKTTAAAQRVMPKNASGLLDLVGFLNYQIR